MVSAFLPPSPIIPALVEQHAEEAAFLWSLRDAVTEQPTCGLRQLAALDERVEAQIDGLRIAGQAGLEIALQRLDQHQDPGELFVVSTLSLEGRATDIEKILTAAESAPASRRGLFGALGWAPREALRGQVVAWLESPSPFRRLLGVVACSLHHADPGSRVERLLRDEPLVRARALRAIGELGRLELLAACTDGKNDEVVECQFWAAWAGVMLGDRGRALQMLMRAGTSDGPFRRRAFRLVLQVMSGRAHDVLKDLSSHARNVRWIVEGSGIAGDAAYVPWLIDHMKDHNLARLAGEAVTLITGVDLSALNLDRPRPENFESGPNDDPQDDNVEMDSDEDLPWPDPDKVEKWWAANASRFRKGTRYFMGAPVTREHCTDVLKKGYQRQRILAANYLCLLDPGTPLFNTSAPAWRQQRLLAKM